MIDRDYFSHDIPGAGRVFDKLSEIGYCYKIAGENIGWNTYPDDQATAAIQQMFMDSSGHRANILGSAWEVIGVGAYKGPGDKKMWTVLFADTCGSTPKPTPKPTRPKPTPKPTPEADPKPRRSPPRSRRRSHRDADANATRHPERDADADARSDARPNARASPTPTRRQLRPRRRRQDQRARRRSNRRRPRRPNRPRPRTPAPTPTPGIVGLRVTERGSSQSLLEMIVTGVTGFFFGG